MPVVGLDNIVKSTVSSELSLAPLVWDTDTLYPKKPGTQFTKRHLDMRDEIKSFWL